LSYGGKIIREINDELGRKVRIIEQGGDLRISALIKNEGFSQAHLVDVSFYKGDPETGGILLGTETVETIPPGGAFSVSFPIPDNAALGSAAITVQNSPTTPPVTWHQLLLQFLPRRMSS
jgi:hypothetical protein